VRLTLDFYRRNCIEGLFLSSGIIRSPDYTMEQVVEVGARAARGARLPRLHPPEDDSRGEPELLARAGRYADRLSINVELPTSASLAALAPEKDDAAIRRSMARLRVAIDEAKEARPAAGRAAARPMLPPRRARAPALRARGAEHADDHRRGRHVRPRHPRRERDALRRLPAAPGLLLGVQPDPRRGARPAAEGAAAGARASALPGRLADALLRLRARGDRAGRRRHALTRRRSEARLGARAPGTFPGRPEPAPQELLLRVPGLGTKSVARVLQARRVRRLRAADLERMHLPLAKLLPFVIVADHRPGRALERPISRAGSRPRRSKGRCSPESPRRGTRTLVDGFVRPATRRMESSEHAPYSPPPAPPADAAAPRSVTLASAIDLDGFRAACRRLWAEQVEPGRVSWHAADDAEGDCSRPRPRPRRPPPPRRR
jgi:hypothetical protein